MRPEPSETGLCDGVVLLHGIARRAASLRPMERRLAGAGYATLNLDYPARRLGLSAIVEQVARRSPGSRDASRASTSSPTPWAASSSGR